MVKIFVGRLAESVTRDELQKLFEKYGEVSDCDILRDYGFVHMADESRAQKAIRELDRLELGGSRISVELSTSRSMKSCQLVVGNLPENTPSADVHKLFKKFGTVTLCRISGGQAVVHMRWASMAVQAIRNLNGETYKGCVLSVQFATNNNTPLTKNTKDEWYGGSTGSAGSTSTKVQQIRVANAVGPRYNQNAAIKTQTTSSSILTQAWTNYTTNASQSNHVISNGAPITNTIFSTVPGTNQNNNLANSLATHSTNIPTLLPNNHNQHTISDGNLADSKTLNNNTEQPCSQSGDSPSHSSISSSSYEEPGIKQMDVTKTRTERRQYIQQGLQFLQSPRPWSGSPEEYATFLNQMKQMLLQEGSELIKENLFNDAVRKLSEALNMCKYMESEGIKGHNASLVTLLTERSLALRELGQLPPALDDANQALQLCNGTNQEALRCKVMAVMKMGNPKEAYDILLQFSHTNSLDLESSELMSNLTQILGLRARKPYRPASQPFATPYISIPPNDHMMGSKQDGSFSNLPPNPESSNPIPGSIPKQQNLESFTTALSKPTIATEGQSFRNFTAPTEHFSNSFPDQAFKPPSNDPTLIGGPNGGPIPNMSSFPNRPQLLPQQQQPGFNKTPGTALHGYPPTVGAGLMERSNSTPSMNGGSQTIMPKPPVAPIGSVRPAMSRMMSHPYGVFSPTEAVSNESGSIIGDSLRKNLEMMTGEEPQAGPMFGQPTHSGTGLSRMMENSLDLVSGIQKLAVNNQLKENGIVDDHPHNQIGPRGNPANPASKMWDYMGGKQQIMNNNNNIPNGNGGQNFSPGMPAPIGYRKPFTAPAMGGDASSLLSPGQGIRPDFGPSSTHNSPSVPFLTNSGDSAFNMVPGLNKMPEHDTQTTLKQTTNSVEFPYGVKMQNSGTVMSTSSQFGAVRLSSDPNGFAHSGPSYSHFPQGPSNTPGLSQLFGPSALGFGIPSKPPAQPPKPPMNVVQAPLPSTAPVQKTYSEPSEDSLDILSIDEDDSLDSYLRNPLHNTHEFRLGCSDCVIKTGPKVIDYRYDSNLSHMCYKNILLCRRRDSTDWHKIRPRPQPQSKAQLYDGPYYICKDLLAGLDCTYPVVCTFAYNQEEIDVWTLERKQMLNRRWLFDSLDEEYMGELTVVGRVLCKHRGLFSFLCQACFTNKPRIISTFSIGTGKCINENAEHCETADNRQLTHILRDTTVRYTAIRVPAQQAILCRHEVRFQCTREEDCHFAHSLVERDVWALMLKKNLTPDQIVDQSRDYVTKLNANSSSLDQGITQTTDLGVPMFRWKVKFICSLCYKNGQISEATKDRKYCTARAQHSWATNKKTVLVQTIRKDWTQIRDLPYLKNKGLPARFELCENIRRQKKCPFSNKCNFAHSQEELDIWIYLRDNQLKDLEELHDSLNKDRQQKAIKGATPSLADPNAIRLPTDFLPQSAYHCWLCNKECNGQRQWEQHCLSVKHRHAALSDSDGNWKYRNPGGHYEMCERHLKNMCEYDCVAPVDNKCRYAHSGDELEEWKQRREYILNRIKKAQIDQLISTTDDMDKLIKESQEQQQ